MDSKNKGYAMTTSNATIYTCPSGKTATITAINVANTTTSNITATLSWYDSSASTEFTLINAGAIPTNMNYTPVGLPLILESGDYLKGLASSANCHVTISVLEK